MSKGYFRAGVDYEWSGWENIDFVNTYLRTRNSNRYSFGVEFPSLGLNKGTTQNGLIQIWWRIPRIVYDN